MKNKYEVRGDITVIYLNRRNKPPIETMISTKDFPKADSFPNRWYFSGEYVQGYQMVNKKIIGYLLHRVIMDNPEGLQVDHINHNKLDNRSSNLRIVTTSENMQNISGNYATNKSGYRGVYWESERQKWRVRLKVNGKRVTVGRFDNYEDAITTAKKYVKENMPYSQEALAK